MGLESFVLLFGADGLDPGQDSFSPAYLFGDLAFEGELQWYFDDVDRVERRFGMPGHLAPPAENAFAMWGAVDRDQDPFRFQSHRKPLPPDYDPLRR
jgi:hypothetical protein